MVVNGRGDHDNLSSLFFYSHIVSQNKLINESEENDPVFFVNKHFAFSFTNKFARLCGPSVKLF